LKRGIDVEVCSNLEFQKQTFKKGHRIAMLRPCILRGINILPRIRKMNEKNGKTLSN
jgi:hypothetical protein